MEVRDDRVFKDAGAAERGRKEPPGAAPAAPPPAVARGVRPSVEHSGGQLRATQAFFLGRTRSSTDTFEHHDNSLYCSLTFTCTISPQTPFSGRLTP